MGSGKTVLALALVAMRWLPRLWLFSQNHLSTRTPMKLIWSQNQLQKDFCKRLIGPGQTLRPQPGAVILRWKDCFEPWQAALKSFGDFP